MTIQGYGYGVMDEGSAWRLDRKLSQLVENGFTHAEVRPEAWQVWQDGKIENRHLARLTAVLDKYRPHLNYVMHLPAAVNLFDLACREEHLKLLHQGLKVGQHIGAELLFYHPGYRSYRVDLSLSMRNLMAQERDILHQLADVTTAWDSQIALITPDCLTKGYFTYAILPDLLTYQLKILAHPHIGLCLDFNQLYLAANWCGFDYAQAVQRLLPLATHFHLQDRGEPMTYMDQPRLSSTPGITYLPSGWHSNMPSTLPDMPSLLESVWATLDFVEVDYPASGHLSRYNEPIFKQRTPVISS